MTGRELAWRVFASELNASTAEERGSGEKSPSYVVSPLGARMNRVLVTGTITPLDRPGTGSVAGFVRANVTDPTGTVPVTTGSYQPHGQADLEKLSEPTRVLVVGKAALIRGQGTAPLPAIRAEAIRPVTDVEYRTLTAEAATQTLDRLGLVLRLKSGSAPSDAELARTEVSPSWIRGARASIARYPTLNAAPYVESLRAILIALRAAPKAEPYSPAAVGPAERSEDIVRIVRAPSLPKAPPPPSGLVGLEGRLLEILDELAEESADGYADMDELAERAARHGLAGERMEELLNYLSENGTLEEPLVGKFRRAEGPPRE
jgi:uncharacterized protein